MDYSVFFCTVDKTIQAEPIHASGSFSRTHAVVFNQLSYEICYEYNRMAMDRVI